MEKPNIHLFQYNGYRFLFDVNTCVPLEVNPVAYRILQLYGTLEKEVILRELASEYSRDEMVGVFEDIGLLKENGLLSSPQYSFRPVSPFEAFQKTSNELVLMVSQDCNLGCAYCFGDCNKGKMSEETAYQAIDYMLERSPGQKKFSVTFFGGEPLTNFPLIEKTLDYCEEICKMKDVKINYRMTTNGTILNNRILERMKKHNIEVTVSLDGPEEIHDRYRKFRNGKGTFKVIVENVKLMSQYIPVSARVTLTKYSPAISEIGNVLEEIGVKNVYFSPVIEDPICINGKNKDFDKMGMTERQLLKLEQEFDKICEGLILNCSKEEPKSIYTNMMQLKRTFSKRRRGCDCGGNNLAVSVNGDLYPCHWFVDMEAFKLGNIWDGLNGESYANFFNEYDKSREKCRRCWAVNTCGGGCANEAVVDGCRFRGPNESKCIQIRAQKEGAIYLHMKKQEKKMA
jgi:radical SAM additional 4Fe4S-binding domain